MQKSTNLKKKNDMEAPEKIYLQEPTKVRTEKLYDNDVEYIRTDVFIEKTCEWLKNNMYEGTCEQILSKNPYPFMSDFIEEFRKVIK
jgi:hypothetical protein